MNQMTERRPALADYPDHQTITTRVADMDGYGHLNAIRTGQYYENARASFYGPLFGGLPRSRMLVAELTMRYLREGFWPGDLIVGTGIVRIGRSSFHMGQGLFQNSQMIGTCTTVLVNTENGAPAPYGPAYRERLERFTIAGV